MYSCAEGLASNPAVPSGKKLGRLGSRLLKDPFSQTYPDTEPRDKGVVSTLQLLREGLACSLPLFGEGLPCWLQLLGVGLVEGRV